ncbi:hypothetical protein O1V64_02095 [Rouxiella badensis]|nr:hypothetical protein O1V64_02095 [Rouxiella badensis]
MVDHAVKHHVEVGREMMNITPPAQMFIDTAIINHAEAVVGTVGVHRQNMNVGDNIFQVFLCEMIQRSERRFIRLRNSIAIGDEIDIGAVYPLRRPVCTVIPFLTEMQNFLIRSPMCSLG